MAPSAIDAPTILSRREALAMLPAPTVYPVQEVKFEKYMPPQIDGREKALARPQGTTAIVIDNGKHLPSYPILAIRLP